MRPTPRRTGWAGSNPSPSFIRREETGSRRSASAGTTPEATRSSSGWRSGYTSGGGPLEHPAKHRKAEHHKVLDRYYPHQLRSNSLAIIESPQPSNSSLIAFIFSIIVGRTSISFNRMRDIAYAIFVLTFSGNDDLYSAI